MKSTLKKRKHPAQPFVGTKISLVYNSYLLCQRRWRLASRCKSLFYETFRRSGQVEIRLQVVSDWVGLASTMSVIITGVPTLAHRCHSMATNSTPLILSVSRDERLLHSRQMVLESAGWHVVTTMDTMDALRWLAEQDFHVVVMGHSIPAAERVSLAQKMKLIKPDVPIVMICIQGDDAFRREFADARVGSLDGPVVLINAIRRLTQRAEKQGA